jgi:hypothetical protein
MVFTLPTILIPRDLQFSVKNEADAGPKNRRGRQQRVFSDAGYLELVLADMPLSTPEHVRQYRSMLAKLRQGEEVIVDTFDMNKPDLAEDPTAEITLIGDHDVYTSTLAVTIEVVELDEGSVISDGEHSYMVLGVQEGSGDDNWISGPGPWDDTEFWDDGGVSSLIRIAPPTRLDYDDGKIFYATGLRFRGYLADLSQGEVSLSFGRWGHGTLTITESI